MMSILKKTAIATLLLYLTGTALVLLWYLSHTAPLADDFWFANNVNQQGVIASTHHIYLTWGGRWLVFLLTHLMASLDYLQYYHHLMLLLHGITLFTLVMIFRQFIKRTSHYLNLSVATLLWLFISVNHPGEPIFWLPGVLGNTLAVALNILLLTTVYRVLILTPLITTEQKTGTVHPTPLITLLLMFIGAYLLPGLHEVYAAWTLGALIFMSIYSLISARGQYLKSLRIILVTLSYLLGLVTVIAAPGNYKRLQKAQDLPTESIETTSPFIEGLASSFNHHLSDMLINPLTWALLLLTFVFTTRLRSPFQTLHRYKSLKHTTSVFLLLTLLVMPFTPLLMRILLGMSYPQRVSGAISLIIIMSSIILVALHSRSLYSCLLRKMSGLKTLGIRSAYIHLNTWPYPIILLLVISSLALNPRYQNIGRDLTGEDNIRAWQQWYIQRHLDMRAAGQSDHQVYIEKQINLEPQLFWSGDIRPSHQTGPYQWRIKAVKEFHNLNEIKFQSEENELEISP